jgi:macrophage erythroblast attacher
LIQSFRLAIYTLNTLPTEPLLHLALYAGLASLKLPSCYDHDHAGTKNVDCPVCDAGLGKLAEEVPFSHHVNSTIVCRLSGKIMDADNMPMVFPDGNVYSREVSSTCRIVLCSPILIDRSKVLEDMAAKNGGLVTCPRTGTTCEFSELRKVFIS